MKPASISLLLVPFLLIACTPAEPKANTPDESKKQTTNDDAKQEPEPNKDPTPPEPGAADVYELAVGSHIGPIRLGMTKAEVEALGVLQTHPEFAGMTVPFDLSYEDDKVSSVGVSLSHSDKDIRVGDVVVPRNTPIEEVRGLLGDCDEAQVNKGATVHSCREGGVRLIIGGVGSGAIWMRVAVP